MTHEEAIKILKTFIEINGCIELPIVINAVKKAIDALEKQIPKKPTHEATLYRSCTCPKCKNVIDDFTDFAGERVRVTADWCKYCGQALDWSDT